jgi:hypothetical protein
MKENEDFESYLSRVMIVLGEYRDANRGGVLDNCDLLGFLCVGLGAIFQNIVGDLGRMKEEDMSFDSVVV